MLRESFSAQDFSRLISTVHRAAPNRVHRNHFHRVREEMYFSVGFAGRNQKIWALRIAGEDDSIEREVIQPWTSYPEDEIRQVSLEAWSKKTSDKPVLGLRLAEVEALIQRKKAKAIFNEVERMLKVWLPYVVNGPSPEVLNTMMKGLASLGNNKLWREAALLCLQHSEDANIHAALRVLPPHHDSLLEVMAKLEETQTGWARKDGSGLNRTRIKKLRNVLETWTEARQ